MLDDSWYSVKVIIMVVDQVTKWCGSVCPKLGPDRVPVEVRDRLSGPENT